MTTRNILTGVVRHLHRRLGDSPPDGELLARFAATRDESAFSALVRRHGGLVLGVARRQLGDRQQAEDVFQTTILVLARRASRLGRPASLVNWLYTVALRQAQKARIAVSRRAAHHARLPTPTPPADPLAEISGRELLRIIDDELAALPETYRLPLLLCAVEGLSREEAAHRLGWTTGAVKGRLERGRESLRRRLEARGLTVPAVLIAFVAADSRAVPVSLVAATTRAALAAPATVSMTLLSAALLLVGAGAAALVVEASRERERPEDHPPVAHAPGSPQPAAPAPRVDAEGVPLPPGALARLGSSRMRHASISVGMDLSPDGRLVASLGADGLRVWDAATGRLVRRLDVRSGWRPVVRFSADGRQLLYTNRDDPTVFLRMDLSTGRELLHAELGGRGNVDAVVISPSGHRVAVSDQVVKEVRVYDASTGKVVRRIGFTGGRAFGLGFSHDDRSLAVADLRDELDVYDLENGRRTVAIKEPGKRFGIARFAPDGRTVATLTESEEGHKAAIWDVATGAARHHFRSAVPALDFNALTFSPDGRALAVGIVTGGLVLFDTANGQQLRRFPGPWDILHTAFSRDGRTIAGVSNSSTVALWDVNTGRLLPASADPVTLVREVRFTEGGRRLVGVGVAGPAITWDPVSGREVRRSADLPGAVGFQQLSVDGRLSAGVTSDGAIQICDADTGQVRHTLRGEKPFLFYALLFSADGRLLFATDRDRVIWIWGIADGQALHRMTGHGNYADVLVTSPDGRWLASASSSAHFGEDFAIRLWDLTTYREVRRLTPRPRSVWAMAFSPDGRQLAGVGGDQGRGSDRGEVQVWHVESGQEVRRLDGHTERTTTVAFSPDGRMLATGAGDKTLRLWEVRTGAERVQFTGHAATIEAVAFAPNGRTLAASSREAPVYIWDVYGLADQPGRALTSAEIERTWIALAGSDAKNAFQAVSRCIGAAEFATAFLRDRLKPATAVDLARVRELVRQLDSERFSDRHQAAQELERIGEGASAELRIALQDATSAEMRTALQRLLSRIDAGTPETLRCIRAVEVLEHIGTPAAKDHLRTLAGGAAGAELTKAAAEALQRLSSSSR